MQRSHSLSITILAIAATGACCLPLHAGGRRALHLAPSPAASQEIVCVRGDQREGGDLWLVDADGRTERRLTAGETLSDLAVDARRVACLRKGSPSAPDSNIYVLAPPDWQPRRVTAGGRFATPCWKPGTDEIFAARMTDDPSCDEGLYVVNSALRTRRRLLAPVRDELEVAGMMRLSPQGRYLAAGTGITATLLFSVLDLKTGRRMRFSRARGLSGRADGTSNELPGGCDMAWLDEEDLLLAGTPDDPTSAGNVVGGIRRLSLRTHRLSRWLFSPGAAVVQLCRSPRGGRFAVGLGSVDTPNTVPWMAQRIEWIDARTKARHPVILPGPAHVCGFSRDGTRLLLLVLSRTLPPTKDDRYRGVKSDVYVADLRSGRCHRVARQAFDAAWIDTSEWLAIDESRDRIGRRVSDTSKEFTPGRRTQ